MKDRKSLIEGLCGCSERYLYNLLHEFIISKGYDVKKKEGYYIAAKGQIPILVIAHLDTVFHDGTRDIYYDPIKYVMWSPEGLGADDRAGVAAITSILMDTNLRPHLLFTQGEETGGQGAFAFINEIPKEFFGDIKYIIELDRQGHRECVFYNCLNEEFKKYIINFGFIPKRGIFTDISIIAPKWDIAAVNLSVGYEDEHTYTEILHIDWLEETIIKVTQMLEAGYDSLFYTFDNKDGELPFIQCEKCHKNVLAPFAIGVHNEITKNIDFICADCMKNTIKWCGKCGQAYYKDQNHICKEV